VNPVEAASLRSLVTLGESDDDREDEHVPAPEHPDRFIQSRAGRLRC
jgi:hypothetical protein